MCKLVYSSAARSKKAEITENRIVLCKNKITGNIVNYPNGADVTKLNKMLIDVFVSDIYSGI